MNGPTAQLQAIRRDVQATDWPTCGRRAADLLVGGMDTQIKGILGFMAGGDPEATRYVPDVGQITYSQLSLAIGQKRADEIFFADSYAAITAGQEQFGEFATELAYAAGEQPRPASGG